MTRSRSILLVLGLAILVALALASPVAAWNDQGDEASAPA